MNRLRETRIGLGMTQADVAARLQADYLPIDQALYSKIENGYVLPTEETLKSLERLMHKSRRDLFDDMSIAVLPEEKCDTAQIWRPLVDAIPEGRDKAITRATLASVLGMSDRQMRRAIESARRAGMVIINDGHGYYRSDDISDIRAQYRREKARLKSIYAATKRMRDILKEAGEAV